MASKKTVLAAGILLFLGLAVAQLQHHPFSELGPADEDLDFEGHDIQGVSEVELDEIVAREEDITVYDSVGEEVLVWDSSEATWSVLATVDLEENDLENVDDIDMEGDIEMEEGSVHDLGCIGDECPE